MTFGLTSTGFAPERLPDITTDLTTDLQAAFGNNIKLDAVSVNGQLIGVMAARFADLWAAIQNVYSGGYLNSALGTQLDNLFGMLGLYRNAATLSVATLTITGTPATSIPAGSTVRDSANTIWTTASTVVIGGGGTITVLASPAATGPIPALAGTLTIINSPISGWSSVTNAAAATMGSPVETDVKFLSRGSLAVRSGAGCSADAIRAYILKSPGVTECVVLENNSGLTDAQGRPSHTIEIAVRNGVDSDIQQRIWASKPAGCNTFGNQSGVVVDSLGNNHTIYYSRPVTKNITVVVTYSVQSNFPADGAAQITNALTAYGATLTMGQEVSPWQLAQSITCPKIDTLVIQISDADYSLSANPIPMTVSQLAVLNTITLVRTN